MFLEEKYTEPDKTQFLHNVKQVATWSKIEPDWLMALMYHESGFNSKIKNSIGCYGLFQFHPTYHDVGQIKLMTGAEQVLYWYKAYGKPYTGKMKSFYDVCLVNFAPAYLGKPNSFVFPNEIYLANKPFDTNKDGKITISEYKAYLRNKYPSLFSEKYYIEKYAIHFIIAFIVLFGGFYIFTQKK